MSLLEALGSRSAPSRLIYDDEFALASDLALDHDTSTNNNNPLLDPLRSFAFTPTTLSTDDCRTLLVGLGLGGDLVAAMVAHTFDARPAGSITVTFPPPYTTSTTAAPLSATLPVIDLPGGVRAVSLPSSVLPAAFPAELHGALARSLLQTTLKGTRVVAVTSVVPTALSAGPRAALTGSDLDVAPLVLLAIRNPVELSTNAKTTTNAVVPAPVPLTIGDVTAALMVEAAAQKRPGVTLAAVVAPGAAADVPVGTAEAWIGAIMAEVQQATKDGQKEYKAAARHAVDGWRNRASASGAMYM